MASRAGKPAQPRPLSCRTPENEKPGGTISLEGSTCAPGFAESIRMCTDSKIGSQIQGLPCEDVNCALWPIRAASLRPPLTDANFDRQSTFQDGGVQSS